MDDDRPCPCGRSHTAAEHNYKPDKEAAAARAEDIANGLVSEEPTKYRLTDIADRKGTHILDLEPLIAMLRDWSLAWTPIHRRWLDALIAELPKGAIDPDTCFAIGVQIDVVYPYVVESRRTEYIAYQVWATSEEDAEAAYAAGGDEVASDTLAEEVTSITLGSASEVLDR